MKKQFARIFFLSAVCLATAACLGAQVRTVGRIVAAVEDPQGAAIVGAELMLESPAIGLTRTASSGPDGHYVFTDLPNGAYRLKVTVAGFKTGVFSGIQVEVGGTTNVTAKLELGPVTESVMVEAAAEVLQTTSTAVESSVSGRLLRGLPLNNRDVLDFVMLLPGAQQGGSARQSTFEGLPKGAINITMDGINVQDNLLKSSFGGGMFTLIRPRLDSVEEISVTSATGGAESGGEGAIQIKFVTRRGTNDYHGAAFWSHRNNAVNANTWFNNAAVPRISNPRIQLNQWGVNVGGPIIPTIKDKLFFFFNFEDFRLPEAQTRVNTVLNSSAANGLFSYKPTATQPANPNAWTTCAGTPQVCKANLLSPALLGSLPSTIDPTIGGMLSQIAGTLGGGSVSTFDLNRNRLRWDATASQRRFFPTLRLDYQITKKLNWYVVGNWNHFEGFPDTLNSMDPSFPGLKQGGGQFSKRWSVATAVNWQIGPALAYEFRLGRQRAHVKFFPESLPAQVYPNGLRIRFPFGLTSTNTRPGSAITTRGLPSDRDTPTINQGNNLGWARGKHTFNFGTSLSIYTHWDNSFQNFGIPIVDFGVVAADTNAANAISSSNLPGISTTDVGDARALYALLTGRISSASGSNNVDDATKTYLQGKPLTQRNRQNEFGLYFTDSWRVFPSVTLNYGLRWEYQGAPYNTNGIYTSPTFADLWGKSGVGNLFKPGTLAGNPDPQISLRTKDLYERSFRNFAPSLGFAWKPPFNQSVWNRIFGGPEKTVIRAGYSIAYTREGLAHHTTYAGGSPGATQSISLTPGVNFTAGSQLLRNPLSPFSKFPTSFSFPAPQSLFTFAAGNDLFSIDPNLRTPYVQSWSIGVQRELSPNMALEVRYVGNHGTRLWRGFNINEANIFENKFLQDFVNAQNNLRICADNRVACTGSATGLLRFDNRGLLGQVDLPIFSDAFNAPVGVPALPAQFGFANGSFVTLLQQGQAGALANQLASSPLYICRLTGTQLAACATADLNPIVPGIQPATLRGPRPPNFFQVNPDSAASEVVLLSNAASSTYNGLQLEFRRRLARGLLLNANYTWSHSLTDLFADSGSSRATFTSLRNRGLDKGPSPWDIRHVLRVYWIYELPFGPGRRWSSSNAFLKKVLEGWEFLGVVAVQSGRVFKLTSGRGTVNQNDSGVLLSGLTPGQLQGFVGIVKPAGTPGKSTGSVFFVNRQLIGSDGRANTGFLGPPATPGQFGSFVYLYGPNFVKPDFTIAKKTSLTERVKLEFRAQFLNAFNYQNFLIGAPGGAGITHNVTSTTFGQTSTIFNDLGNQDPGPRMIEFMLRISF